MNIVVHVTEAELRGTPLGKYRSVLGELIGEGYAIPLDIDDIEIVAGKRASVKIDGEEDSKEAKDILKLAKEITRRICKDGYFG